MNNYCIPNDKAWYALRKTLPPWRWQENLDELLEICVRDAIDEVVLKIDTGTFTHYYPDFDWLLEYQKILFKVKEELSAINVVYSLNPNVTQGHGDRGRNMRDKLPDFDFIVGHGGECCTDCACQVSPGWRKYISRQWTIYAETKPEIIWIEDDIRFMHHGVVKYGCYCNSCMRRFADFTGTEWKREDLVNVIMSPGNVNIVRRQWLDFQRAMSIETMLMFEKVVHQTSPSTVLGLMSSGPMAHCAEGRDWTAIANVLAGERGELASRPNMANYSEQGLHGLLFCDTNVKHVRHAIKRPTIEMTEIENYPYTSYSKSDTYTALQTMVSFSAGADAVTLNLFDHCGTPMDESGTVTQALAKIKPYASALKACAGGIMNDRGVRVFWHEKNAYEVKLGKTGSYDDFRMFSYAWAEKLYLTGLGVTYGEAGVCALCGQAVRCLSENELHDILSKGVICDAVSIKALVDMGYSELIGTTIDGEFALGTTMPLAGERYYNIEFGGDPKHYFSLAIHKQHPCFIWLHPVPGAVEISEIVDPDIKRICPGITVYENRLGGRIVLVPFDIQKIGMEWLSHMRKKQLYHLIKWAGRGEPAVFVEVNDRVMPFRRDAADRCVVGAYNLSLDVHQNFKIRINLEGKSVKLIKSLQDDGTWQVHQNFTVEDESLLIDANRMVDFRYPVIYEITFD
ncbi:MAG: hypothetical protein JXR78_04920 [Victivallales bacterium]|nr:hypothetical protein [Victivallales bacterium]